MDTQQDMVRHEVGTVQMERRIWFAGSDDDAKMALVEEHTPEEPWQERDSAIVQRVRTPPAGMIPIRAAQRLVLWLTPDVLVHVGWAAADREPHVIVAQEGCVVTFSPRQVDAPAIKIASHRGDGVWYLVPRATTPEGLAIASLDLGDFVVYRGGALVRNARGETSKVCGAAYRGSGRARAYDPSWNTITVDHNDLWLYEKTHEGREGAVVLRDRPFTTSPWKPLDDFAFDLVALLEDVVNPTMFDRWEPLPDALRSINTTCLTTFGELVQAKLLPALAPVVFQETELYRARAALRKKLGG